MKAPSANWIPLRHSFFPTTIIRASNPETPPQIVMAPKKRVQSQTAGPVQAPVDNVKERRVATGVATSTSRKRRRVSDRFDEAETSQVDQVKAKRPRWSRVAGRLAGLMEMPMDILFEVRP